MTDHMLSPILAKLDSDDDVRTVLVDWMTAAWVRHFDPEEALDLANTIVTEHPTSAFNGIYSAELITRTMWRMGFLLKLPDPELAAQALMNLILNADERYLASIRAMNAPFTDGEG